ncbi:MAG TPA: type II secretion system protein [Candidatus Eremiobacteraceae bacterium]
MRSRGFTIVETIFSVVILALLIIVVGDAVSRTLHTGSLDLGRASESRGASGLEARLNEEARSATSVFVPALDVLGQDNSSTNAHEVDYYRKASNGSDAFVAYRFDRASGTVTRYDYVFSGKTPQPSDADLAAIDIASFFPEPIAIGATGDIVNAHSITPVSVYYGSLEHVGGNGVVSLAISTVALPDAPAVSDTIHLAAKSAPTDLAELVTATPQPKGPVVVAFIIVPKLMKGPWHGGGPDGDPGQIHGPGLPGTAMFVGGDGGPVNWFEISNIEPMLESGSYRFTDFNGYKIQLTISCDGSPCSPFSPKPQFIPGGPKGVVFFRTTQ